MVMSKIWGLTALLAAVLVLVLVAVRSFTSSNVGNIPAVVSENHAQRVPAANPMTADFENRLTAIEQRFDQFLGRLEANSQGVSAATEANSPNETTDLQQRLDELSAQLASQEKVSQANTLERERLVAAINNPVLLQKYIEFAADHKLRNQEYITAAFTDEPVDSTGLRRLRPRSNPVSLDPRVLNPPP